MLHYSQLAPLFPLNNWLELSDDQDHCHRLAPLCGLWFASSSALRMWYVGFDLGDKCWNKIFFIALSFLLCSWKVKVLVTQSYLTLCNPMYCSLAGSSVHEFSRQEYQSVLPFPSPGDLPQGSNLGLLHCRQILYHLSLQGSPVPLSSPILWGLVFCSLFFFPTWPSKLSPGINWKTKVTALIRF